MRGTGRCLRSISLPGWRRQHCAAVRRRRLSLDDQSEKFLCISNIQSTVRKDAWYSSVWILSKISAYLIWPQIENEKVPELISLYRSPKVSATVCLVIIVRSAPAPNTASNSEGGSTDDEALSPMMPYASCRSDKLARVRPLLRKTIIIDDLKTAPGLLRVTECKSKSARSVTSIAIFVVSTARTAVSALRSAASALRFASLAER